MGRQSLRVLLASEHPEARYLLREVVEGEGGSIIIAQAENAARALTLAKNLRPDVAIIDCFLPYTVGLDAVPLSRVGGLDAAQIISENIPDIRVVLVNNLERSSLPENGIGSDGVLLSRTINESTVPVILQKLHHQTNTPGDVVFANIETKNADFMQKVNSISGKAIFFGGLGVVAGFSLMLTLILSGAGIVLTMAGLASMFLGLLGKIAHVWLRKGAWPRSARYSSK